MVRAQEYCPSVDVTVSTGLDVERAGQRGRAARAGREGEQPGPATKHDEPAVGRRPAWATSSQHTQLVVTNWRSAASPGRQPRSASRSASRRTAGATRGASWGRCSAPPAPPTGSRGTTRSPTTPDAARAKSPPATRPGQPASTAAASSAAGLDHPLGLVDEHGDLNWSAARARAHPTWIVTRERDARPSRPGPGPAQRL